MVPSCVTQHLLGLPPYFRLLRMETPESSALPVVLFLLSEAPNVLCPACKTPSSQAHSHYCRTLRDLPCCGRPLVLHLRLRRFFCRNPVCPRRIFVEPIPTFARKSARRTERLRKALERIGYTCGGRAGVRLAANLGMSVNRKSLLGWIRTLPFPARPTPRVLGVDDWAIKKGLRYGTLLFDLERHRVVELLPDRSAESFMNWLKGHPGVEVVSRDRAGCYAQGATEGAPHARQIADRWHLLSNAVDALIRLLIRLLIRHHASIREAAHSVLLRDSSLPSIETSTDGIAETSAQETAPATPTTMTKAERESAQRREGRKAQYEQVLQLYEQGLSLRAVARLTDHSRITVRRYVGSEGFPELSPRSTPAHPLDRFADDLQRYGEESGQNAVQLLRRLRDQGYAGSYSSLRRYLKKAWGNFPRLLRRSEQRPRKQAIPGPRTTAWLLLKQTVLDPDPKDFVERLCSLCPDVKTACDLILAFFERVRNRQWALLDPWLKSAEESGLPEMQSFAKGIRQDYAAVLAGMTYEWSNGAVEGAVNRLKSIKRAMYGRANFDLLRARVLQLA
jgi:transposase